MNLFNRSCCRLPSAPHRSASRQQQLGVQEELIPLVSAFPHPRANPASNPELLSRGGRSEHPFWPALAVLPLTCSFILPTKAAWEPGHPGGCNPPYRSPGASQTALPWQREETCDEASLCELHENAPILSGFNEESSKPAQSWYFLACSVESITTPRQIARCTSRSPPLCPAGEPQTPSHRHRARGQGFQRKGLLRAGRQPCHEGRSSPSHEVISQIAETTTGHFMSEQTGVPLRRGACPGARGVRVVTSEMQYRSIKLY